MAHTIVFKKSLSPVNKFDKSFGSDTLTLNVVLKENTDIFRPTFVLQTSDRLWNYNYIDATNSFGRLYFITDVRSIGNNRYEVDAKTDVLSTWKSEIRGNSAVIRRQEGKYNLYLDDPEFHVYNYERIQTLQFPENVFNKNLTYVLVVNGSDVDDSSQLDERSEENGVRTGNNISTDN